MKVNERELLLTIEATLTEFLPLSEVLELLPGVQADGLWLGGWQHGQELDSREAWEAMRHPDYWNGWQIVPLKGGRLVMANEALIAERHTITAKIWQDRAVGIISLLSK